MISDPSYTTSELRRLEEILLAALPDRQWEVQTVTFPASGQAMDVAYTTLTPSDPSRVDVRVLQSTSPVVVYKESGQASVAGLIRLKSTTPGAQVTLLLTVSDDNASRVDPTVAPQLFGFNGLNVGLVGTTSGAYDTFLGPGIDFNLNDPLLGSARWQMGIKDEGADDGVMLMDRSNDAAPFWFRRFGGKYYFQPGKLTNPSFSISIGNPNDSFLAGWWDAVYAKKYYLNSSTVGEGEWQAYTTTWSCQTGAAPVLGNGVLSARYTTIDGTVHFEIFLTAGSTTTFGGGNWLFTLPLPAADTNGGTGSVFILDASTGFHVATTLHFSTSQIYIITQGAGSPVSNVIPMTWAQNDVLRVSGTYKKA